MFQGNTFKKNEIDYQFIVVYEKFNKQVANSIKQQAISKRVKSTIWSEKDFRHNEANLTNYNHVLFLSEKMIEETLANPKLKELPLVSAVFYKQEGNSFGIYTKDADFPRIASDFAYYFKENWKKVALKGVLFSPYLFWSEKKQAKLYLLYKAGDYFIEKHLEAWIKHS